MARSCRLALLAAAGVVGAAARGTARAPALRGAGAGGDNTTAGADPGPNATRPNGTAGVGFAPGSSPCDCASGCSDRHCGGVNEVFGMIRWDRDGPGCQTSATGCRGGALLHMIGSPEDVDGLLGADGRISWLSDLSFGGLYHVINDCQYQADESQPSCSAAAILRSDLLPIVFNYPDLTGSSGSVHPIGLLFDPWLLQDAYSIKAMFVLDGATYDHPWSGADHPPCTMASGWDWPSDYNAAGGAFDTSDVGTAMIYQCRFGLEQDANWAGFWGNFIDARKAALRAIRDGSFGEPDGNSYMEPEIDIEISDDPAWDSMYRNALKAVVVQTNYCSEQLGSTAAVNKYCTDAEEDSVIRLAKLGACRVALQIKQDTGNDLPVIEANLLTNSMYNHDAWEQFRSGEDYLANAEDYMQYYDCCWLLNEASLYDQLHAAGWYDGQCCWEQDGAGGWKNCDYCTNCA